MPSVGPLRRSLRPPLRPLPDEVSLELRALIARRRQLIEMMVAEKNRLSAASQAVKKRIEAHIRWLENATLAAVVIVYSVGLIQPMEFLAIRKVRTMEFRWAIIAALGVLMFGTLKGIVVAIIASLIGLSSQAAYPRVSVIGRKRGADVLRPLSPENPDDETFEGLLIVRPEGRLFFVNAQYVADQIGALVTQYKPRVVALDMSRVPDIEYSALQAC